MNRFDQSTETEVAVYARLAEQLFREKVSNQEAFEERVRAGLLFSGPDPYAENKIKLTRLRGLFSLELFQAMICGGASFRPMYVSILWDRLLAAGVVFKAFAAVTGAPFVDHHIDEARLSLHLGDDTFLNLFASPARLLDRYRHALAAVDVSIGETQSRGTGFVVMHEQQQYFVTCKHNVDPAEGVTTEAITSSSGETLHLGRFELSKSYDIATARLVRSFEGPFFAFSDQVEVFDEVFTLGYPYVPRANSMLLGHRGEMNGKVNLYAEKCSALIISNLVSPGSSGGPVLTRDGHCVGMTIDWLEGEWGDTEKLEKMRFSAALPADTLREAVEATP